MLGTLGGEDVSRRVGTGCGCASCVGQIVMMPTTTVLPEFLNIAETVGKVHMLGALSGERVSNRTTSIFYSGAPAALSSSL